jgi:small basic protein
MAFLPLIGLLLGIVVGSLLGIEIPSQYAPYLSVVVLAALDSTMGGVRALLERTFTDRLFFTGFLSNVILAAGLTYLGDRLGVNLYLAVAIVFGIRLFQNLSVIRRLILR